MTFLNFCFPVFGSYPTVYRPSHRPSAALTFQPTEAGNVHHVTSLNDLVGNWLLNLRFESWLWGGFNNSNNRFFAFWFSNFNFGSWCCCYLDFWRLWGRQGFLCLVGLRMYSDADCCAKNCCGYDCSLHVWFHSLFFGNHNTYHALARIATESFCFSRTGRVFNLFYSSC